MDRDTRDRDKVETLKNDTHDAVDELKERVEAGAERVNRTVRGGDMSVTERIGSHARELKHDIKGDVDRAKREMRDDAAREGDI